MEFVFWGQMGRIATFSTSLSCETNEGILEKTLPTFLNIYYFLMALQVYTCPHTHQGVYIKHEQLFSVLRRPQKGV